MAHIYYDLACTSPGPSFVIGCCVFSEEEGASCFTLFMCVSLSVFFLTILSVGLWSVIVASSSHLVILTRS